MEKIDKKFYIPEKREDRIKRLDEAVATLKSEFVGLDEIIDKIKLSITPWYVTPEIITRPTVISLWGMTGTGKTSVVKRLIDLLGLANKAIFFDCGEESNTGNRTVGEKINDIMSLDDEEDDMMDRDSPSDLVFVFDEFQHARTLNERKEEVDKPNLRSVWNLLDTGILRFDDYSYELNYFNSFLEDFTEYAKEYPAVPLERGQVTGKEDVKNLLENLGYFYYDRNLNSLQEGKYPKRMSFEDGSDEDPLAPLNILDSRIVRVLIRRMKKRNKSAKTPEIINEIMEIKTTGDMAEFLKTAKKSMTAMKEMNCNRSLIFVLGNLDEAFGVEGDLNPDIDADVFYDKTSSVSITDIKNALKERFRAEQIARFGNSIIKYPTLKKTDFMKVIHKETSRVCNEFEKSTGYKLTIEPEMYNLLYSEGVYPVQGVRPIFTTVGTILTPLFSDIVINFPDSKDVSLGIKNPEEGYKVSEKTVLISSGDKTVEKTVNLILGSLRKPDSKKTRYINAVHETGHALVMAWTTGKLPLSIVAISSESGGFCLTYDPDKTGEINCKRDVENSVMISMGGYLAEELIYPDQGMRLMGSGSDIEEAWEEFSSAAYKGGYYSPFSYCNFETYSGVLPGGIKDDGLQKRIIDTFRDLKNTTRKILSDNKSLLIEIALRLGKIGEMKKEEFYEYLKKDSVFMKQMEAARKQNSPEYYKDILYNSVLDEVKKEGE
jgi:cell division protease FtsH